MVKRSLVITAILFTMIGMIFFNAKSSKPEADVKQIVKNGYSMAAEPKEQLYQNVFVTMLMPYMDNAIKGYYEQYLTLLPREDPWFVQVLSAQRIPGGSGFDFLIKLEVRPYIGPHDTVGIDHITFKIKVNGEVTLDKFEHIKSFPIPQNLESIIKKWPPE